MLIPSLLLFAHARGVGFNMIPLLYGRIPYDFASTNSHASLWHFGFMVIVFLKAQLDLIKIKASCTCCAYYLIRCQTPEMGARVYSNISGHGSMKERTQDAKRLTAILRTAKYSYGLTIMTQATAKSRERFFSSPTAHGNNTFSIYKSSSAFQIRNTRWRRCVVLK